MMKRIAAILCPLFILLPLTACGPTRTPPEAAQSQVNSAHVLKANTNAELMFQNAQNYASSCIAQGNKLKPGRYDGKLGTGETSCSFSGDSADFQSAQNTYTNGMTGGYYSVTVGQDGMPTVAYWSEDIDLSGENFPPSGETFYATREKLIGRYPDGAVPDTGE